MKRLSPNLERSARRLAMTSLALNRTTTASFAFAGEELVMCLDGAAFWPAERLLVVADLHLEKGSSFAQRRVFLPPYDTATTLKRLAIAIARHDPKRIVLLGDTFHDRFAEDRLTDSDRDTILALLAGRDAIFVAGNHDPLPTRLAGQSLASLRLGPLYFCHEPGTSESGEVAGHLHPVARIATRGRSVRRRAFVSDGKRLILPAFGAYAGGLNVRDAAFNPLFRSGFSAVLIGDEQLFSFTHRHCLPD